MTKKFKQKSSLVKLGSCIILCLLAAIVVRSAATAEAKPKAVITVNAESAKMVQDGEKPALKAKISGEGDLDLVLDEESGYSVDDLLREFKKGEHYKILCDADGTLDGKFPMELQLSEKIEASLASEWIGKVKVNLEDGTFVVKNKYGEWEEEKFKKTNGEYAAGEYIVSEGNKYYFDKNGKKVTGKQQIGRRRCEFAKDGRLLSEEDYIDPDKPMLALTFDDGPGRDTGRILDALEEYGAKATFFMLGEQVDRFPEAVKRMQEVGCELANHSKTHTSFTKLTPDEMRHELNYTSSAVKKASGSSGTTVFRPPYGATDSTVRKTVGVPIIMWSVDTLDWKTKNVQKTVEAVMNDAKDGDIVLMHDIHKTTVEAVEELIPMLVAEGYQLVTVSELAEARGVSLENGVKYSQFYPKK